MFNCEVLAEAQYWILDGKLMKQHSADNITSFTPNLLDYLFKNRLKRAQTNISIF